MKFEFTQLLHSAVFKDATITYLNHSINIIHWYKKASITIVYQLVIKPVFFKYQRFIDINYGM